MSKTHFSHQINSAAANFVLEIIPLDHANTVLAGGCTLHFDGTFDHAVDKVLCETMFLVVIQDYGYTSQLRSEYHVCLFDVAPHHESCRHQRDQQ
jgi:hypothetical protein